MGVVPFSKTGTSPEDTEWSWDAASQNAILGDDGDDWTAYKAAHTWWDGESGAKSHYKLPHHRMGDSGLEAVWHGVSNAMARLEQADIPEGDMKGCFDHLAKHYEQWDKEPPEWDRWLAGVKERRRAALRASRSGIALPDIITMRAPLAIAAVRQGGTPSDADMAYIAGQVLEPVPASQLYVIPTESSNTSIDSYFTQMTPQTLGWYAEDATRGVSFLDSHNSRILPIGRTFYGATVNRSLQPGDVLPPDDNMAHWAGNTAKSGEIMTTQILTYMLRGMQLSDGLNSNDLIQGFMAGIYRDISVGFIPRAFWCNVCGLDMLRDWDCRHWPGATYTIKDADTGDERSVLCLARIDANLVEHSTVYAHATPNAMTLKAQRALDSGRALSQQDVRNIRLVEATCRVKLLRDTWSVSGLGQGSPAAAAAAKPFPGQPATRRPIITDEEADTMRGSEFIARFMQTAQEEATRAGKKMSDGDLATLQTIHDGLRAGHDTMDDGIRGLADFMATQKAAEDETNTDSASNPGAGDGTTAVGDLPGDGSETVGANAAPLGPGETRASDGVLVRADGSHDPMTGSHAHDHSAYGSQGDDAGHDHNHSHDGDANHNHSHGENAAPSQQRAVSQAPANLTPAQRAIFEAGERYLTTIRDDAIGWAVRAGVVTGPEDEAKWRGILSRFAPDEIEAMSADWASRAGQRFSPRGHFVPSQRAIGGGAWTTEPTGEPGRQTQASDPNNPIRLPANRPGSSSVNANTASPTRDDVRLYSMTGGKATGKPKR